MPTQLEDRQHISRAFRFSAVNQIINRIMTFGSGIITMRILSPNDVGTFAAATAFVVFCTACNDICMGQAIIQHKGDLRVATRTAVSVSMAGSFVLYALFFVLAPFLGDWLGDSDLSTVLRILMILVIIDGLGTVPMAILTRSMRQKLILGIETASLATQIFVTVILALGDHGPYALVWGMIASNLLSAVLVFIAAPEAGVPGFNKELAASMIRYGTPIALSNIFRVTTQYCDNLVVGAINGTKKLGYYQLGYNGGNLPENTIGGTVVRVSFAWFSQIRDNVAYRKKAFHDLTLGLIATTLPFVIALSVLSKDLVLFLYGEKWIPAANIVRILAILGGIRVFLNFFADIFAADGNPILELKIFALWSITLIPTLILGAFTIGIDGVALAHVFVALVFIAPYTIKKLHDSDFPVLVLSKSSLVFVVGGICQAITTYSLSRMISSPFASLIIAGLGGVGVFVLVTYPSLVSIKNTFTKPDHGFGIEPAETSNV